MLEPDIALNMPVYASESTRGSQLSDLVDRCLSGDREAAFNELYRRFAPTIHGVVLARVPYDEVDDIVQDVFLTAYKQLGKLRDKNALGAWLVRIARNAAVEYYRRARPSEELAETIRGAYRPRAEAAEIMRTLRALPEAYRETLVLRLIEGLTGQEIADVTGLKPESVRVNLHRGMELLRLRLGVVVTKK